MEISQTSKLLAAPCHIQTKIFQYLYLDDLRNLFFTCKGLNTFLVDSEALWAKGAYKEWINNKALDFFMCEDPLDTEADIAEEDLHFNSMFGAKKQVLKHYFIRERFHRMFSKIYREDLKYVPILDKILDIGKNPCLPEPILKKDIHHFPTKTEYTNYLTEQFHGIHKAKNPYDRRIKLMVDFMSKLDIQFKIDSDKRIARLRWFGAPDKEIVEETEDCLSQSSSGKRKRIKKVPIGKTNKPKKLKKIDSNNSAASTAASEELDSNSETESNCDSFEKNDLELLFDLVKEYTVNYCKLRLIYLNSHQKMVNLLKEYSKCWKKFVFVLIEMTKVLQPYSEKINKLYKETKFSYVNFSEFSFWRMMVRIWVSEVFQPLSYNLGLAFRSLIIKLRMNNVKLPNGVDLKEFGSYKECLKNILEGCIEFADDDSPIESLDKTIKVVSDFHLCLSDISFNECTVFFNDCLKITNKTPRDDFENLVAEDSVKFFDILASHQKSYSCIDKMFDSDLGWIKSNFDKNIYVKVMEKHQDKLKNIIRDQLSAIHHEESQNFEKIEEKIEVKSEFIQEKIEKNSEFIPENVENNSQLIQEKTEEGPEIILESMTPDCIDNFANMSINESQQKSEKSNFKNINIMNTEKHLNRQELMDLAKNYQNLSDICYSAVKLHDTINNLLHETNEIIKYRFQRGYVLVDEKYELFFSSCKNPPLEDIFKYSSQKVSS